MSKLEIGTVISEGFSSLDTRDIEQAAEALGRFSSDLEQLDANGWISKDAIKELIWPHSATQAQIEDIVSKSLSDTFELAGQATPFFEPGASSIVMKADGSEVLAVYNNPNPSPGLEVYGNQLKWALKHAAYAAISGSQVGGSPILEYGYLSVENAIRLSKGKSRIIRMSDTPPKLRHHLGGEWMTDRLSTKDALGPIVAATSGVLFTDKFLQEVRQGRAGDFSRSYMVASLEGQLDGFDGNFLAGLSDYKVSRNILNWIFKGRAFPIEPGMMMDLERGLDGLNLH